LGIFFYKSFFINLFLNISSKFYLTLNKDIKEDILTLNEKEELNLLKIENKILKEEKKKMEDIANFKNIQEDFSPTYLLLGKSNFYGDFYISLPKNKTPYKSMYVFSGDNVVVGQVDEIYENSLRVNILGQNKSFIANVLESDESIELKSLSLGLYTGNTAGSSKISTGDSIVLKGYPKGLVGIVVEVRKNGNSLSDVYVRAPYNMSNKEIFYVN
jgi:cell shape-determining protein MreC